MSGKLLYQLPGYHPTQLVWQTKGSNFVALALDKAVKLMDRSGRVIWEQSIDKPTLAWNATGQLLSLTQNRSNQIVLFQLGSKRARSIDFELKDHLTIQAWSRRSQTLAIGTSKGSLILYDSKQDQSVPILGKHAKRICQLVWSRSNLLALGSIDGLVTVNNEQGDTLQQQKLRAEPTELKFGTMKSEQKTHADDTVSCLLDQHIIFLWRFTTDEQSELSFQAKYGKIVNYEWYGDGYITIGFDSGRLIGVSTHMAEIGTEIFNIEDHPDLLTQARITPDQSRVVTAGESSLRIHATGNMKVVDQIINIEDETAGGFTLVGLSDSGALIAAATATGSVYVYLTELNVLGSAYGSKLAFLSSLNEVTLFETGAQTQQTNSTKKINLQIEPSLIAIGPYYLTATLNNKSIFYSLDEASNSTTPAAAEPIVHEYTSSVKSISLGIDYAVALLSDGRLYLHSIENNSAIQPEREAKIFPEGASDQSLITSALIRGEMMIYVTIKGKIHYFLIDEWSEVNCYEHGAPLKAIYADHAATRLLLVDESLKAFIYSPVDDSLMPVPEFPAGHQGVAWDAEDGHVFCVWDAKNTLTTYAIHDLHVDGPKVEQVAVGRKPKVQQPLMLHQGHLYLQTNSGKLNRITLQDRICY